MKKKDTIQNSYYPKYFPKSENQKTYINYLNNDENKIVFAIGPAGTGKTLFACNHAVNELKRGNIKKIIITRPVVPVEEDLGFLPGNINKKMDPWVRPIFDVLLETFTTKEVDAMVNAGIIEISPLAYMRGRTFKESFIIADEMQNSSPNQMLMLLTRVGLESRMVVTGDLKQSDKGVYSGLYDFMNRFREYSNKTSSIKMVEFQNIDVERSPIVKTILDIYGGA